MRLRDLAGVDEQAQVEGSEERSRKARSPRGIPTPAHYVREICLNLARVGQYRPVEFHGGGTKAEIAS